MISACRKCGKLVEMTEEEAMTPIWSCRPEDRLCIACNNERVFVEKCKAWHLELLKVKDQEPAKMPYYPRD